MKTISLHIGDKLRVLADNPFGAGLSKGQLVRVVGFSEGNSYEETIPCCPKVKAYGCATTWYTGLKKLFHYFKKEK